MVRRLSTKRRKNPRDATALRARVSELEQTLQAIRGGLVDALVVTGASGFQVYTLQGAEHPYRMMVESLREGAATLDADGHVLYANEQLAEMLDVPLESLIGAPLQSQMPAAERSKLQTLIQRGRQHPTACEISVGEGGERRVLRVSFSPLKIPGQEMLCAVVTEVTELVEANEAQRKSELKLQALSGRLLKLQDEERRHISRDLHDVSGQNLAALNMTLSELERVGFPTPNPEAHTLLQQCRSLSEQVSQEIRTLSYVLHPPLLEEVGLASAVRWYANGFGQRTGVRVEVDTAPGVVRLSQDAEIALFRVLQESLTNVHRYSESDVAFVRLSMRNGSARLEVEDKGKGIADEDLTTVSAASTLGVGIQGMRERMRQLSGTLEIASRPGEGTRVTAAVPIASHSFEGAGQEIELEDAAHANASSNGEEIAAGKRVLIVDDHEMMREGVRRVLQRTREWTICGEASNGKEAVERASSLHPDLVILDLSMPVLNGLDALKQIRQKCPHTKVLVFTVNSSEHVVREISAAGADGYLCKSDAADELLETLKALFENEPSQHAAAGRS